MGVDETIQFAMKRNVKQRVALTEIGMHLKDEIAQLQKNVKPMRWTATALNKCNSDTHVICKGYHSCPRSPELSLFNATHVYARKAKT